MTDRFAELKAYLASLQSKDLKDNLPASIQSFNLQNNLQLLNNNIKENLPSMTNIQESLPSMATIQDHVPETIQSLQTMNIKDSLPQPLTIRALFNQWFAMLSSIFFLARVSPTLILSGWINKGAFLPLWAFCLFAFLVLLVLFSQLLGQLAVDLGLFCHFSICAPAVNHSESKQTER